MGGYNPYRNSDGTFASGPNKKIQYSDSSERDEAMTQEELDQIHRQRAQEEARKRNELEKQNDRDKKVQKIQEEMNKWYAIQDDPYSSPYLREKSFKELSKLRAKMQKLK